LYCIFELKDVYQVQFVHGIQTVYIQDVHMYTASLHTI